MSHQRLSQSCHSYPMLSLLVLSHKLLLTVLSHQAQLSQQSSIEISLVTAVLTVPSVTTGAVIKDNSDR